jgi:hypothetical protein
MNLVETKRVMAIDPTTRGFGFVTFEGPERLIDWAVVEVRGDKNNAGLRRVADLIAQYRPDVLVLEDTRARGSRRCFRVRKFLDRVRSLAEKKRIATKPVSRTKVRRTFSEIGATTKYQMALAIAKRFPELMPRLPRFRKPWMTEDARMSIFNAASFVQTFFRSCKPYQLQT